MSTPNTTTIAAWTAAIVAALRRAFAAEVGLIGAYSLRDEDGVTIPRLTGETALLLRAGNAQHPADNKDLSRHAIEIEWTISAAVPTLDASADTQALDLAIRAAGLVRRPRIPGQPDRGTRWDLGAAVGDPSHPELPEWDDIALNGYLTRPVRWRQVGFFAWAQS